MRMSRFTRRLLLIFLLGAFTWDVFCVRIDEDPSDDGSGDTDAADAGPQVVSDTAVAQDAAGQEDGASAEEAAAAVPDDGAAQAAAADDGDGAKFPKLDLSADAAELADAAVTASDEGEEKAAVPDEDATPAQAEVAAGSERAEKISAVAAGVALAGRKASLKKASEKKKMSEEAAAASAAIAKAAAVEADRCKEAGTTKEAAKARIDAWDMEPETEVMSDMKKEIEDGLAARHAQKSRSSVEAVENAVAKQVSDAVAGKKKEDIATLKKTASKAKQPETIEEALGEKVEEQKVKEADEGEAEAEGARQDGDGGSLKDLVVEDVVSKLGSAKAEDAEVEDKPEESSSEQDGSSEADKLAALLKDKEALQAVMEGKEAVMEERDARKEPFEEEQEASLAAANDGQKAIKAQPASGEKKDILEDPKEADVSPKAVPAKDAADDDSARVAANIDKMLAEDNQDASTDKASAPVEKVEPSAGSASEEGASAEAVVRQAIAAGADRKAVAGDEVSQVVADIDSGAAKDAPVANALLDTGDERDMITYVRQPEAQGQAEAQAQPEAQGQAEAQAQPEAQGTQKQEHLVDQRDLENAKYDNSSPLAQGAEVHAAWPGRQDGLGDGVISKAPHPTVVSKLALESARSVGASCDEAEAIAYEAVRMLDENDDRRSQKTNQDARTLVAHHRKWTPRAVENAAMDSAVIVGDSPYDISRTAHAATRILAANQEAQPMPEREYLPERRLIQIPPGVDSYAGLEKESTIDMLRDRELAIANQKAKGEGHPGWSTYS